MSGESLSSTSASSYYSAPASEGVPKPICFISHAWDNKRINEVVAAIQYALGIAFDVATDITSASGANNPQTLLANIRKASLFVCILDNLRPNVAFELGYARAHNIPFILLLYENAEVDVRSFLDESGKRTLPQNPPLGRTEIRIHLGMLEGHEPKIYSTAGANSANSPVAHIRSELDLRYEYAPTLREAVYRAYFKHNRVPATLRRVVEKLIRERNPLTI
ncbi:MAG: hypothetical protein ACLQVA_12135 [Candidatus Brocadiia bacterium]